VPIEFTEEMMTAINNAAVERVPCLIGTASKDGVPDVSIRGSMMAWDSEHLAFWERSRNESLANLEENGKICVFYRNPATRLGWRFWGEATILKEGELRQQIMDRVVDFELAADPERKGYAVLIRVDRVRRGAQVIMEREPD
jgi:uncharacterized protein